MITRFCFSMARMQLKSACIIPYENCRLVESAAQATNNTHTVKNKQSLLRSSFAKRIFLTKTSVSVKELQAYITRAK